MSATWTGHEPVFGTCVTCGGPIFFTPGAGSSPSWRHARREDWVPNVHPAEPKDGTVRIRGQRQERP